jgi:hypothetical protein
MSIQQQTIVKYPLSERGLESDVIVGVTTSHRRIRKVELPTGTRLQALVVYLSPTTSTPGKAFGRTLVLPRKKYAVIGIQIGRQYCAVTGPPPNR